MKLIPNWRDAWKWFSVQSMAIAMALQGTWLSLPVALQSKVPSDWVFGMTIAVLVLGFFGRLVDQGEGK